MHSENKYEHGSIITTDSGTKLEVVEEYEGSCNDCYFRENNLICKIGGEDIPCIEDNFILKVPDDTTTSSEVLDYEEYHRVC